MNWARCGLGGERKHHALGGELKKKIAIAIGAMVGGGAVVMIGKRAQTGLKPGTMPIGTPARGPRSSSSKLIADVRQRGGEPALFSALLIITLRLRSRLTLEDSVKAKLFAFSLAFTKEPIRWRLRLGFQ